MNRLTLTLAAITYPALALTARANAPFFSRGATSFDPEVSVVNTGIVQEVQATVSPDRKYVTLNMRAANSTLLALREFSFQNGANPLGQVGIGPAKAPGAVGAAGARGAAGQNALLREGMTQIARRGN